MRATASRGVAGPGGPHAGLPPSPETARPPSRRPAAARASAPGAREARGAAEAPPAGRPGAGLSRRLGLERIDDLLDVPGDGGVAAAERFHLRLRDLHRAVV